MHNETLKAPRDAASGRDGHVEDRAGVVHQAKVLRRGQSRQDGALAAREHRRQPAPERSELRVTDGVDVAVDDEQAPTCDHALDPMTAQAAGDQLAMGDHPVLPLGQPGQHGVASSG